MPVQHTPIRAAIVGAGIMGRWHADAAARLGATIAAVIDPDASRAATIASRYAGCRALNRLDDAIDLADVFHVCTPTHAHVNLCERAILARRHVIVEKPLADTAAETARLFDLALERGVVLCPVHQFLFQPGVRRAAARLPQIGPVRDAQLTFWSAGAAGRSEAVEDAIAFDILPHPFYLLRRLLHVDVGHTDWSVKRPAAGELRLHGFHGAASLSIRVSMHARPTTANVVISGDRGTLAIDLFHGFSIRQPGAVSRARKIVQPFHLSLLLFGGATANLARRAARREPAYPGLRELIRHVYSAAGGAEPPIGRDETISVAIAMDRVTEALNPRERSEPASAGTCDRGDR